KLVVSLPVLLSDLGVAKLPLGGNWSRPQRIGITALLGAMASTSVGVRKSHCIARAASVEIPGGSSANGHIIEPGLEAKHINMGREKKKGELHSSKQKKTERPCQHSTQHRCTTSTAS
uniref:Uncharacterized protein n=1 Tax=Oryza brachyantha TaxID=4533 RepID=J3M7Q9_ORYBR